MPFPVALVAWLLIGVAAAVTARLLLPGRPPLGWATAVAVGLGGALAGGGLATLLGFGGLVGLDLRGVGLAALGAAIAVLLARGLLPATEA